MIRTTLTIFISCPQKQYRGFSDIVVRPESTAEVSEILKYCNEKRIGVVPQGGNTGLVGGSVPLGNQEIVLSMQAMSTIYGLDPSTGILKAEAGCVLQDLQDYAANPPNTPGARPHLVPVDLGAKGTCQIGGNLSTKAGGSYYYRYGSLQANVIGLEVVLANGDVMNLGYDPSLLKDNTGYDMKHIFVGAEGTLGIITRMALLCPPMPSSKAAAFLACDSYANVCQTLIMAKTHLGEILAAFEFMDSAVLQIVKDTHSNLTLPLDEIPPYALLIETHGSNETHDQEKMEGFVEHAMEEGLVVDGVLAQTLGQVDDFWKIRESCNPSVASQGYVYKYDVSLAIPEFEDFIEDVKAGLSQLSGEEEPPLCTNWGHVIDGNLHLNVVVPGKMQRDVELYQTIESLVLEGVLNRRGSISAEHGLGQYKSKHLAAIKDPASLTMMQSLKSVFDPNGILNPGKLLG